MKRPEDCYREEGACIEGDTIYVECRKPGRWKLIRMSGRHEGRSCKAEKNAMALLLRKYTNVKE
jgi:hypothetical protein